MNDFMRPTLYQAHHDVLSVRETAGFEEADLLGSL